MSQQHAIEELLRDFAIVNPELSEIISCLRNALLSVSPDLREEIKYGGIVFSKQKQLLAGLFLRKKFVTMEFGFGNELIDEDNMLEGSGKFRRNLKFEKMSDIETKRARYFIEQAVKKNLPNKSEEQASQ